MGETGLTYLHVFPFSPRRATPAARMPQLARPVVAERARRLREAGAAALAAHLAAQVGRVHTVLTERGNVGRTEGFAPGHFANGVTAGVRAPVRIAGVDGTRLVAEQA